MCDLYKLVCGVCVCTLKIFVDTALPVYKQFIDCFFGGEEEFLFLLVVVVIITDQLLCVTLGLVKRIIQDLKSDNDKSKGKKIYSSIFS